MFISVEISMLCCLGVLFFILLSVLIIFLKVFCWKSYLKFIVCWFCWWVLVVEVIIVIDEVDNVVIYKSGIVNFFRFILYFLIKYSWVIVYIMVWDIFIGCIFVFFLIYVSLFIN